METETLVQFSEVEGVAVFTFLTSIGVQETAPLKKVLREKLKAKTFPQAVMRMEHVHFLDSSGLGVFISLKHEFLATTKLRFCGLNRNVRMVFEYSNLLNHFHVDDTYDDSLKTVGAKLPSSNKVPPRPAAREFLPIEGKYILTDNGVKYCAQKLIPVQDIRLYRGASVVGFVWSNVDSDLLERFVTHGLLAGMELERTEFLDKRQEILRLIEVLFNGISMKRFRPLLKLKLMEEPAYRQLVAQEISPEKIRSSVRDQPAAVRSLKDKIERLVSEKTSERKLVGSEDSQTAKARIVKLLDLIDDSVWFLLNHAQSSQGNLEKVILDMVVSYADRLNLSEYIAINLMEFLQLAERAHFFNLAERDPLTRKNSKSVSELLADPQFRERLIAKARLQNEFLVMNMNFDGTPYNGQRGLVVEISVRNKGVVGNQSRTEVLGKKNKAPLRGSLEDFLQEQSLEDGLEKISLFNLNALKDLCRDQGIFFETGLTRDERADETVASLRLIL